MYISAHFLNDKHKGAKIKSFLFYIVETTCLNGIFMQKRRNSLEFSVKNTRVYTLKHKLLDDKTLYIVV